MKIFEILFAATAVTAGKKSKIFFEFFFSKIGKNSKEYIYFEATYFIFMETFKLGRNSEIFN